MENVELSHGQGWAALVEPLLALAEKQGAKVLQVKEKFGGLRFYYDGGDAVLAAATKLAEQASYRICEQCGEPGKARDGGWTKTLCSLCEHQRQAEKATSA